MFEYTKPEEYDRMMEDDEPALKRPRRVIYDHLEVAFNASMHTSVRKQAFIVIETELAKFKAKCEELEFEGINND